MKTPPRTQLVIRFAPGTNTLQAVTDLRAAGWDAWERDIGAENGNAKQEPQLNRRLNGTGERKNRRRKREAERYGLGVRGAGSETGGQGAGRDKQHREPAVSQKPGGPVIEARTSRLRGDPVEVADAFAAQARAILSDFAVTSIEAQAAAGTPSTLQAWQVHPQPDVPVDESRIVRELASGRLYFGERSGAETWARQILREAEVSDASWQVKPYESWSQQIRTRKIAVPVATVLGFAALGILVGYFLAGESRDLRMLFVPAIAWMVAGTALLIIASVIKIRSKAQRPNRIAVAVLYVGVAAVMCGTTLSAVAVGSVWASPAAVGGVLIALLIQSLIGTPVVERIRMGTFRIPATVILTAIGVTLFVVVLNLPIALFYNAAGSLQLVGTASWGVVIGTGFLFTAAVVLACLCAWVALRRWRNFATLFRPRLLFGLVATGMFVFIAAALLGNNIGDGLEARQGKYGSQWGREYMMPVCIHDPRTDAEKTPLWLVGTDGETTVLLDRSRMTGAKKPATKYPHYLDANRELTYVEVNEGC
ncbi:FUSC family protein [Leifsonia sp. 21MFCrub1.1]|uniref:FUSC family protein n=1 Tax=Leifsonia sp. 21MFCrub1.1 TaxID=1798223 RepID=UPI000B1A1F11|nr:FUSC family protein [Leifsonia sp. 21MFCrub1.1]